MIDSILLNLSNSKLFSGCIMLLTNIGGKYLMMELPNNIEKIFSNNFLLRYLVLFSILFMATRDVKTSILLSLLFFIVIKFLLNEKSFFCLVTENKIENKTENKISDNDYKKAKNIILEYEENKKLRNIY
jgi:hypothetical protein